MLPTALRRDIGHGSLQDLQQRLLHALAGHIPGNRGILTLPGDLIDLIHIDDAALGQLNIIVGSLHQAQKDILHVVAHIARLCQRGGVSNGKGHLQDTGQRLCEEGLAAAGGSYEQNVALLKLHIISTAEVDTLIVIVYRHREGHFGVFLADDILVQHIPDLFGSRDHIGNIRALLLHVVSGILQDTHAELDAFVADICARARNDAGDLLLMFAAERAADRTFVVVFGHRASPRIGRNTVHKY